jgi:Flavin-binding monooxygenase-like
VVKPAIDRFLQNRVRFVDGSEEVVDQVIYCTGYRIGIPFLSSSLASASGRNFPLYRRIVPLDVSGLFFAGFVDAPGGLLPVVEAQGKWIAAVLAGQLIPPSPELMRCAMGRAERRTRQRFPGESPYSIRCDPHAYRRLLSADLKTGASPGKDASGHRGPRPPNQPNANPYLDRNDDRQQDPIQGREREHEKAEQRMRRQSTGNQSCTVPG